MITEKVCKQCHQTKPVRAFHKKSDSADGFYPFCKDCRRANGGYKRRARPRVENPGQPITMECLINDILTLSSRFPSNVKYRMAAEELRACPDGPHSEYSSNLLYEAWQKRQQTCNDFDELDESTPVITLAREREIQRREIATIFDR